MTTWTCKGSLLALALSALSGCEPGQGIGTFALRSPAGAVEGALPLARARMSNGAIMLVPPSGFCIDRDSTDKDFALLAHCEALGGPVTDPSAPLGVISVSILSFPSGSALPSILELAKAAGLRQVSQASESPSEVVFHAIGRAPQEGLSEQHWRGAMLLNERMLGVAFYGPSGANAPTHEGRDLVLSLLTQTRAASR